MFALKFTAAALNKRLNRLISLKPIGPRFGLKVLINQLLVSSYVHFLTHAMPPSDKPLTSTFSALFQGPQPKVNYD